MGTSVYFDNCLREIRQSVYGRDNRKPIADAIERVSGGCKADADELYDKEQTRVIGLTVSPNVTYGEGYYTLNITRANGR